MVICKGCDNVIPEKERKKGRKQIYCSQKCKWRITKQNWYSKNKEKVNNYNRKWTANHRSKNRIEINKKRREFYKNIPEKEKVKIIIRKRSFNKKDALLKQLNHRCSECGSNNNLEFHHSDYDLNIPIEDITILLCRSCHNKVHMKP